MQVNIWYFFIGAILCGCSSTKQIQYQIGESGVQQTKLEAERYFLKRGDRGLNSDTVRLPQVLKSEFPDYPKSWQNAWISGVVVVHFSIESDGSVSDPTVEGSPPPELVATSLISIMRWKFKAATKDGVPVRSRATQRFEFKVEPS